MNLDRPHTLYTFIPGSRRRQRRQMETDEKKIAPAKRIKNGGQPGQRAGDLLLHG